VAIAAQHAAQLLIRSGMSPRSSFSRALLTIWDPALVAKRVRTHRRLQAAAYTSSGMTAARLRNLPDPVASCVQALAAGLCACQVGGMVQQRLAVQAMGDVTGFADGRLGGFGIVHGKVLGVVEQAVGEVVGGA
jgi:hypothetical protein